MILPPVLPGDVLLCHTDLTPVSRLIRQAQWRRRDDYRRIWPGLSDEDIEAACQFNHAAIVGPDLWDEQLVYLDNQYVPSVISAEFPKVVQVPLREFVLAWLTAIPGAYMVLRRMPGLTDAARGTIALRAETFEGRPYDVETLLAHGHASLWWRLWHPYAAWITRNMRRTEGALICSEVVVRAYASVGGYWHEQNPEQVDPAMLMLSPAWVTEWDSRDA